MPAPLEGLTVIEVANWVQGPLAAQLLGNLGAKVIKVEQPERGDPTRGLRSLYGVKLMTEDGRALLWELCNRNKSSVCIDLRRPEGQDLIHDIVRRADVFVTNVQRDTLEAFRCTSEELFAVNDQLVYALGGGLTVNGPLADAPAQDTVAMAHSGFMLTSGNAKGEPVYPPGALADVTAATALASGVVSALFSRLRHNDGTHLVTTSLVQGMAWTQMLGIGVPANTGQSLQPFEYGKSANPLMSIYRAGDGRWLAVGMVSLNNAVWRDFCDAIGKLDWFDTTDWGDSFANRARAAHEIASAIQEQFDARPAHEWIERLRARDLPCSLVNHPAELVADEGILADGTVATGDDGLKFVTGPFTLDGTQPHSSQAPALGQDTAAILTGFGYSQESIAGLFESGVVW